MLHGYVQQQLASEYDGKSKSVERSFEATARDGLLVIAFRPSKGHALVSSLSITPIEQR